MNFEFLCVTSFCISEGLGGFSRKYITQSSTKRCVERCRNENTHKV